jgi:site-specific DNA recombinase
MKVAADARVSTQRQAADQTIAQQIEGLQARAQMEGWAREASHVYRDEGYRGARIDRPALDRLRDAAERGEFQAILVTASDRLARRLVHQMLLLAELAPLGCPVIFLEHPDRGCRPDRRGPRAAARRGVAGAPWGALAG